METKKHRDGSVTIRMTYRELGSLHAGLYENIERNKKYALESEDETIKEIYNEFYQLEEIAEAMANLCPYDDHNELTTLNATRLRLQRKINEYFNA